jgi:hypothetical protein
MEIITESPHVGTWLGDHVVAFAQLPVETDTIVAARPERTTNSNNTAIPTLFFIFFPSFPHCSNLTKSGNFLHLYIYTQMHRRGLVLGTLKCSRKLLCDSCLRNSKRFSPLPCTKNREGWPMRISGLLQNHWPRYHQKGLCLRTSLPKSMGKNLFIPTIQVSFPPTISSSLFLRMARTIFAAHCRADMALRCEASILSCL